MIASQSNAKCYRSRTFDLSSSTASSSGPILHKDQLTQILTTLLEQHDARAQEAQAFLQFPQRPSTFHYTSLKHYRGTGFSPFRYATQAPLLPQDHVGTDHWE